MKTEIKNLGERVKKLSEKINNPRQAAFKAAFATAYWNLTEDERQLASETIHEFGVLKEEGRMITEEQTQEWYHNLPPEKRAAVDKLPTYEATVNTMERRRG